MGYGVAILIKRENKGKISFLMMMSSKKKAGEKYAGYYRPLSGWIEEGEDEVSAIIREIREEIGHKAIPTQKIDELPADVPNLTFHWWVGTLVDEDAPFMIQEDEISHVKWFAFEELLAMENLYPSTKKVLKKHKKTLLSI